MKMPTNKQTAQNAADIKEIKADIASIKNNHLSHIESDMARMDRRIEKMDMRIWAVLIMLVASTVFAVVGDKL